MKKLNWDNLSKETGWRLLEPEENPEFESKHIIRNEFDGTEITVETADMGSRGVTVEAIIRNAASWRNKEVLARGSYDEVEEMMFAWMAIRPKGILIAPIHSSRKLPFEMKVPKAARYV